MNIDDEAAKAAAKYLQEVEEAIAAAALEFAASGGARSHLISEAELRAAGALDVPPEWRKSLSAGSKKKSAQRDLFSDLADDDAGSEQQQAAESEAEEDESSDED